jgi:hypothetical protein
MGISNFNVNPADQIYCIVWMGDAYSNPNPNGGYAWFVFNDMTTGLYTSVSTQSYGTFAGNLAEWTMQRDGPGTDLADYWYAVMTGAYAGDGNGNWVNYQGQGDIGIGSNYEIYMYNGNDLLSSAYAINSDTIEFIWSNFN